MFSHAFGHRSSASLHASVWCLLALLLVLWAPSASAQVPSEPPSYRETIDEAVGEYAAHNYLEARSLFARAHALFPNARTLRGLGAVSFELRRYGESIGFLEQALRSHERPLEGSLRVDTERLLTRARGFVASLELSVVPAQTTVAVDGQSVDVSRPLLLEIGEHRLELSAPGYAGQSRSYVVEGGEHKTLRIRLVPDSDEASTPLATTRRPRPRLVHKLVGGGALGLGVASYALAGVFGVARHQAAADFQSSIPKTSQYGRNYESWQSARTASYALAATGAALVSTGALTLLGSTEREAFPWWASLISGLSGVGLVSYGVLEIVRGGPCSEGLNLRGCTDAREQRDRGGLAALGATPLLAVALTQLVRRVFGIAPTSPGQSTAWWVLPEARPEQHAFFLSARFVAP